MVLLILFFLKLCLFIPFSEKKDCISLEDDEDEKIEEVGIYQEIVNSPEETVKPLEIEISMVPTQRSNSLEPLIKEEKENIGQTANLVLSDDCNIVAASVPDRKNNDNLLESSSGTNYEIVDFVSSEKLSIPKKTFDNNETKVNEVETSEKIALDNAPCDTKLSEELDVNVSSVESNLQEVQTKPFTCSVVSEVLKRDWVGRTKDTQNRISDEELSSSDGKTEKLRKMFELDTVGCKMEPSLRTGTKEESDAERRERIERYKEERRTFFRQKYGSECVAEDGDDDLIRRIKQRTLQARGAGGDRQTRSSGELRSPTKTTVSISYSPARVPSDNLPQSRKYVTAFT